MIMLKPVLRSTAMTLALVLLAACSSEPDGV